MRGILLVGSWARGDALRGADVDLEVLVKRVPLEAFQVRRGAARDGGGGDATSSPVVEIRYLDEDAWRVRLGESPTSLYSFRDGRILFERGEGLRSLADLADERWRAFRWSGDEVFATLRWLQLAGLKVRAAYEEGDYLRAALVLSTTLWKTLEGLWMINGLPMPAAGGVMAHLDDLARTPPELRSELQALLLGGSLVSGLRIIDWVADELAALAGGPAEAGAA